MIITVNGFEDAKNYPVMYNSSELLMDNSKDVFYVKSVDNMGKVEVKSYKFELVENELPLTPDNFVTKQQFDSLITRIDSILDNLGGGNCGKQHTETSTKSAATPVGSTNRSATT